MMSGKILVLGGGTFSHVRSHLALAAPAFGTTAKQLARIAKDVFKDDLIVLALTKMADSNSSLVTNKDVQDYLDVMLDDLTVKAIFFSVAMCDFDGVVLDSSEPTLSLGEESGKYATRLSSNDSKVKYMMLSPAEKVIRVIKERRPDIIVVGFKTTTDAYMEARETSQYALSTPLLVYTDFVLSNDIVKRRSFILERGGTITDRIAYTDTERYQLLISLVKKVHERLNQELE